MSGGLGSRTTAPHEVACRIRTEVGFVLTDDECQSLASAYLAAEEALRLLTEGFALRITERVEQTHNEFQRLGLVEGRDNRDSEEGRKCLSSMATDAVYFASLVRDARAALAAVPEEKS